jgi:hypothetical protein
VSFGVGFGNHSANWGSFTFVHTLTISDMTSVGQVVIYWFIIGQFVVDYNIFKRMGS